MNRSQLDNKTILDLDGELTDQIHDLHQHVNSLKPTSQYPQQYSNLRHSCFNAFSFHYFCSPILLFLTFSLFHTPVTPLWPAREHSLPLNNHYVKLVYFNLFNSTSFPSPFQFMLFQLSPIPWPLTFYYFSFAFLFSVFVPCVIFFHNFCYKSLRFSPALLTFIQFSLIGSSCHGTHLHMRNRRLPAWDGSIDH